MKKLADMSRAEIAELLECVADDDIFHVRERLITLLSTPDIGENRGTEGRVPPIFLRLREPRLLA